jgi:hypothetical protein
MSGNKLQAKNPKPTKTPKIPNRQKSQKSPKTSAKNFRAKNSRPTKISASTKQKSYKL